MILRNGTYGDLRIELNDDEKAMLCPQLIDKMQAFLVERFGPEKAATFERVHVSDPGFVHFRKVNAV